MRIAVLWASESSTNLGVRALARGSHDLLRRVWPDADIEYVDFGHRPDELRFGRKRSIVRERLLNEHGMMRWFRGFDLIWDTRSGDSFTDIYGIDRHGKMSLLLEFAQQAGTPTVFAPQTIGPFRTRTARVIAKRNLRRSSLVYARDSESEVAATQLKRPADRVTSDVVFAIEQPARSKASDVQLNVSGLLWRENRHVDHLRYQALTRRSIDALLERGRSVSLLPHVLDSADPDNDVPVVRALHAEYNGRVGLNVPQDLDDVREIVAGANLVIGARMHACLNAISTGTPAIALAYSRKFKPLLDALHWPYAVSLIDGSASHTRILEIADEPGLHESAQIAREQGRASIQRIEQDLRDRL